MKQTGRIRTQRTRSEILGAAEDLFARRGYALTRLEDVAETVHLTRPAVFYHFHDKQQLYDAVLEDAFGSLTARLREVLSAPVPIAQRIERAVEAWVDALVERPTLARLLLRHVADAEDHPTQSIHRGSDEFFRIAYVLYQEGVASGELKPEYDDPFYAASHVIGTTVFYLSAFASLAPHGVFAASGAQQLAALKTKIMGSVRRLLGIRTSRRLKSVSSRSKSQRVDARGKPRRSRPTR